MNDVVPSSCRNAFNDALMLFKAEAARRAPRYDCSRGRGRSVGRSRTNGAPVKHSLQYARCFSIADPCMTDRCQTAKSAYWIGNTGKGDGIPWQKAEYRVSISANNTRLLAPSNAMWWVTNSSTCRVGLTRNSE